jgi:hypothetical protein
VGDRERAGLCLVLLGATAASAACRGFEVGETDASVPRDGNHRVDAAAPSGDDAGADAGACPSRYGARVIEVAVGGTGNQATEAERAEGAPNCGFGGNGSQSLSLGGGHIVLDIGCLYEPGDGADLRVWEASDIYPPCYGLAEMFTVEISADKVDWTELGDGSGPTALDAPAAFRYVSVSDPNLPDDSITPGPDIDALELLQAP